ncbi:hypothetical protein C8Q79DRAFT_285646 [Trametes meyenii]|nr:hypothetical protein C8Q79DRAFT_285646 [Trametes meyenii]
MANRAIHLEPEEFIHHFLPMPSGVSPSKRPTWGRNIFRGLENALNMTEASVVAKFLAAVNLNGLVPGFTLCESQDLPDKGDSTMQKVDAAFFRSDNVPTDGRPHWADQVVAVEFKAHDTSKDPFDDRPNTKVDPDAEERKRVRGQIIEYAEQIFRYQQRTFLFMLLVIGRRFRLLFWDRSGTITTRAVDYFENPDLLCEMLWRLGHLTNEQLGYDPSATRVLPGDEDYRLMDTASLPHTTDIDHSERPINEMPNEGAVFRYVREAFQRSLSSNWPRYRLQVPHEGQTQTFLVGKPEFFASGMAGRGTRGYVALDRENGRFVWLKDAWRAHYELVDQEGSVLAQLNEKNVRNVPTLVCHGDILNQTTRTPEFWELKNPPPTMSPERSVVPGSSAQAEPKTPSSKNLKRSFAEASESDETPPGTPDECPLRRHMHYRLVVEEVAMNLKSFQHGLQLVSIIYDCVIAHRDAMTDAKIMHRDISGGNILIFPKALSHSASGQMIIKWTGLLADWELSKPVHDKRAPPRARQPERTGTWQFMSVGVLSEPTKVIETIDELESFFHVTLYYAVRYLRSNCRDVGAFIEDYFDSYGLSDGQYTCGTLKKAVMAKHGQILQDYASEDELQFESPMDDFFSSCLVWFKAHYTVKAYRKHLASGSKPADLDKSKPVPVPLVAAKEIMLVPSVFYDENEAKSTGARARRAKVPKGSKVKKPTAEEEEDAMRLRDHAELLNVLSDVMQAVEDWTVNRVEADNVPDDYKPKRAVGPARVMGAATFKRLKMEMHSSPVFPIFRAAAPSTPRRKTTLPRPLGR